MEKKQTAGKNWLQLNIQDSSSSESEKQQQTTTENLHQQQTTDNNTFKSSNQQQLCTTRDAFRATKVSRGFFMDRNDNDIEQYDNFQVKEIKMQKSQTNVPRFTGHDTSKRVREVREYQSPPPRGKQIQISESHLNVSTSRPQQPTTRHHQFLQPSPSSRQQSSQSNTQRKMFQLQISDSQQSQLPDSEEDDEQKEKKNRQNASTLEVEQNENEKSEEKMGLELYEHSGNILATGNANHNNNNNSHSDNSSDSDSCSIPNNYKKDFQFTKQPQHHVLNQINPDQRIRTIITRSTSVLNKLWPQFQIKLQSTGLNLLLITKQTFTINSSYKLYSKLITSEKRYFGRIQSNLSKDAYKIFTCFNSVTDYLKAELYFTNLEVGGSTPREFTVYVLREEGMFGGLVGRGVKEGMGLREYYMFEQNRDKIRKFTNRKPIYNQKMGGYVLNFSQRVKKPSIKNFILQDSQTQQQVLMFGRLDKQSFRLQISHPLNCVIGAALVMVQFERRLIE